MPLQTRQTPVLTILLFSPFGLQLRKWSQLLRWTQAHTEGAKPGNFMLLWPVLQNLGTSEHFFMTLSHQPLCPGVRALYGHSPAQVQMANPAVTIPPLNQKMECDVSFIKWEKNVLNHRSNPCFFLPLYFYKSPAPTPQLHRSFYKTAIFTNLQYYWGRLGICFPVRKWKWLQWLLSLWTVWFRFFLFLFLYHHIRN